MRVLHVIPSLRPESGGPSRSVPQLVLALHAAGVAVELWSTARHGEALTVSPAEVAYPLRVFSYRGPEGLGALKLFAAARTELRRFDLVHVHSVWNTVTTAIAHAARGQRKPYLLAPRGMLDRVSLARHRLRKRFWALTVDCGVIGGAARLHFLNDAEAQGADRTFVRLPRAVVAGNGVSDEAFRADGRRFRAAHAELDGQRILGFLGRLHAMKNLGLQLEAFRLLAPRHPDLVWVLVGPDRGCWASLAAEVRRYGLEGRVRWLGELNGPERFDFLAAADCVLLTSHNEGHSIAANEALAAGTPLVVTPGVHFDEVEGAGAGLCAPAEAGAFGAAVEKILTDGIRQQAMRHAARRFADEHLRWSAVATKLVRRYTEILGEA